MKTIINTIKHIILLPYTILNAIESKFVKRKNDEQESPVLNETITPKYFVSMIIWAIVGFLIMVSMIKQFRLLAEPVHHINAGNRIAANGCFRGQRQTLGAV